MKTQNLSAENLDEMYMEMYGHAESNPRLREAVYLLASNGFAIVPLMIWAKYRGEAAVRRFFAEYYKDREARRLTRDETGTLILEHLCCRPSPEDLPIEKFPLNGEVDLAAYLGCSREGSGCISAVLQELQEPRRGQDRATR